MDQAAFFLSFLVLVETRKFFCRVHSFTKKCFPDDFLSFCIFFFGGFCVCVWCFPFSDFADFFVAMKYPRGLPKNWLHYQISLIRQTRRDGEKNIL